MCRGCGKCVDVCPYHAISVVEQEKGKAVAYVQEALCKGCGSCSGFCPSGAAQVRHFGPKQIFAEFDGIMDALKEVGM